MNKKICLFTLIILCSTNLIFSSEKVIVDYKNTIFPMNPIIGEIEYGYNNKVSSYLHNILKQDFSKDWIDKNVSEDYKYFFSKKYSKVFLELLPLEDPFYCSRKRVFENNNAISVFIADDKIIYFILDKITNKIINVEITSL